MSIFYRVTASIMILGLFLYAYIHKKNQLTFLRLEIPTVERQLKLIEEENNRLEFEIERFEHPIHLMNLLKKQEFSHLEYPKVEELIILKKENND